MKSSIFLLGSVLVLSLASCKTKSKSQSTASDSKTGSTTTTATANTNTTQPTVYQGVTDKECAVEMAFGSYGSGIDGPSLDKVTAILDGKKLKYTAKSIGREGERRLCMPLTELKENEKKELIEQLKKIAAEGQLVSVSIR